MKSALLASLVILLIVDAIFVGAIHRANSNIKDRGGYGTTCLNGVTYYIGGNTLTPAFNINGSLIGCDR